MHRSRQPCRTGGLAQRAGGPPPNPARRWPGPTCCCWTAAAAPAAQWAGHAAVVVFWSTTCPFCKRHNQHIEKLYRAADPQTLAILGVAR